jgi:hypothetical protein
MAEVNASVENSPTFVCHCVLNGQFQNGGIPCNTSVASIRLRQHCLVSLLHVWRQSRLFNGDDCIVSVLRSLLNSSTFIKVSRATL